MRSTFTSIAMFTLVCGMALECQAQDAKPADAGASPPPARPAAVATPGPIKDLSGWPTRAPMPEIGDAEVASAVQLLCGSFQSEAVPGSATETPALLLNSARVDVTGLDNAVYFEIARADSHWKAVRQGIFHVHKKAGGLALRVFDFAVTPTFGDAVTGLWIAPDLFPAIKVSQLAPSCDIALTKSGQGYEGRTAGRAPTVRGGAWEFEAMLGFGPGEIRMADRGFDASGKEAFGLPEGKWVVFKTAAPRATMTKMEGGLVVIDQVPPAPGQPTAQGNGARIAVHFSGWMLTDGAKFASSKDPHWDNSPIEPQIFTLPGRMLSGWSMGVPGITKGTMRRLLMPPGLAFGTLGSPQWKVPPNTPVAFDVECMYIEDKPAAPEKSAPAETK